MPGPLLTFAASAFYSHGMDAELAALEARVAQLVDYTGALREANASLQRDLEAAQERHRALADRMQSASSRLDALLERLPPK